LSDQLASDVATLPATPDEVTRRVRRPSSTPPREPSHVSRAVVIAAVVALLAGVAMWLGL
jgi:hypothetical protein